MKNSQLSSSDIGERIILALLFTAIGCLVYVVFSPFRPLLDGLNDYLGRIGLIAILLAVTLSIRRSKRFEKYSPIFLGLLIMAVAVSLDWILAIYLVKHLGVTGDTPFSAALQKLNEFGVIVVVVIALTRLTGGSLGSIFIQKGNLRLGLIIGIVTFLLAAAGSIPMANLFNPQNLTLDRIIPWIPWLLIFVLANAAEEELLFRGLFLRKLQPFFGRFFSNLLIVIVFTLLHYGVDYTSNNALFVAIVFPLALAWGYIMQKTDGIWGSILFHAGMDIPILLGIFSNYQVR